MPKTAACSNGSSSAVTVRPRQSIRPSARFPAEGAIDVKGVKVDPTDMKTMTSVDKEGWKAEIPLIKEHFATFGAKMPQALKDELASLEKRLG